MWRDFKIGLNAYIKAIPFVIKHRFWMYFFVPIVIFILINYLGFYFKDLQHLYKAPEEAGFFKSVYYFFVSGIFLMLSFTFLNFFRYIILIIISPLLSIISEKRIIALVQRRRLKRSKPSGELREARESSGNPNPRTVRSSKSAQRAPRRPRGPRCSAPPTSGACPRVRSSSWQ